MKRIRGLWYAHLRKIDLKILWPACKAQARDMEHAKAAFAAHAFNDRAWTFLGERAVYDFIEGLE